MKKIRTRYAPSPTGKLHIGGARTALFSYLFAKHYKGDFIIRIEDTDISRNIVDGEESQIKNLEWLGIVADESPQKINKKYGKYRQSEKLERYNKIIDELITNGHAYKAYETSDELNEQRRIQEKKGISSFRYNKEALKLSHEEKMRRDNNGEYSIRLSLPHNTWYSWKDIVRGKVSVNTSDIGDFVIRKQNGFPTYNFAVVIDDYDMEISHVLRGEEHITNTPKQLAIYDLLNWEVPKFGHLTIITNMEGKKLSKRDTETKQFIEDYRKDGYIPEAIFNFLTLLGWTSSDAKEIMDHDTIISKFDETRFSKSPSKFDTEKMNWFSKMYMKKLDNNIIRKHINTNKSEEWINLFISTYKSSAITFKDIKKDLDFYNSKHIENNNGSDNSIVKVFTKHLKQFSPEGIQEAINKTKQETGASGKDLYMPIRLATTYRKHGPELAMAIYLFGEEIINKRLGK